MDTDQSGAIALPAHLPPSDHKATVGIVVIGRNEGARLAACLSSLAPVRGITAATVYVDSGSHDGSVSLARSRNVAVVELDPSRPFTAARARDAGAEWMVRHHPEVSLLQFVDGDCELSASWLPAALATIRADPRLAVVCGRRRERHPEASPYNRLCDREWNTPLGIAKTCGGDALVRADAFRAVGGFNPALIAGEEPDFCHRLRQARWLIRRIGCEMTTHDAAMTRFGQWWQRNRRSGYATAEALSLRGEAQPALRREVASNLFWAFPLTWPLWPLLWLHIWRKTEALYATFTTLGKLPHAQGQLDYWRRRRRLIEYK